MRFKRSERLQELFLKEISFLIQRGLKDPRVGFATVTRVELGDNLRHAKVFLSVIGTPNEVEDTLEGLQNARGYIRSALGKNLHLKFIPELHFKRDDSFEKFDKIARIINQIHSDDGRNS